MERKEIKSRKPLDLAGRANKQCPLHWVIKVHALTKRYNKRCWRLTLPLPRAVVRYNPHDLVYTSKMICPSYGSIGNIHFENTLVIPFRYEYIWRIESYSEKVKIVSREKQRSVVAIIINWLQSVFPGINPEYKPVFPIKSDAVWPLKVCVYQGSALGSI